jgi:hypothetical protein
MTYIENNIYIMAIDGLTIASAINKHKRTFVKRHYHMIDWSSYNVITKERFDTIRLEVIDLVNELNSGFND